MSSYILKVDGTVVPVLPKQNEFSLEELQKMVGGLIEMFDIPNCDATIVCNDEAKLLNMPFNPYATIIFGGILFPGDYFSGDIAIIENKYLK